MKQAVASLYAYIMKFLVRALEWYEEGKVAHAIHSITKPAALRYDDLIKEIQRATHNIAKSAVASSHAEQRDIHHEMRAMRGVVDAIANKPAELMDKLDTLTAITNKPAELMGVHDKLDVLTDWIKQLREAICLDQSVNASARIEFRHALSDTQLTQALSIISSAGIVDHQSSFEAALIRRDRHRSRTRSKCTPFWLSGQMQTWDTTQSSSSILLKAAFRDRHHIQDLCTNVIEQLTEAGIATLWVLKGKDQTSSVGEILKSLVRQALALDSSSHTDLALSFQLRKFLDAHCDEDYVILLGDILGHFRVAYIIIEAEAMTTRASSPCQTHLRDLSRKLSEQGAKTILKVMVLTYGAGPLPTQPKDELVLKVGRASRRKGKNIPAEPLRNINGGLHQPIRKPGSIPSRKLQQRNYHDRIVK